MSAGVGSERLSALVAPRPGRWLLDNGLRVVHLPVPGAAIVSTALCYKVGTADEMVDEAGVAHFLEHMMFKGSERYGPGEIDRTIQALGGWSNAFTGHDSTVYLSSLASEVWREALAIEADRMKGLTLGPREVDSEREVVIEEIGMYLDDPWSALELAVHERLFGEHPYARPILGTVESLERIDDRILRSFHERHYAPGNAVLAIAGELDRRAAEDAVAEHFEQIPGLSKPDDSMPDLDGGDGGAERMVKTKGETARLLLTFLGPRADDADHGALVVALSVLAAGRVSRLQQRLVEDRQLCSRIGADISEMVGPGTISISAEAMPGVEPASVEEEVLHELRRLIDEPPSDVEIERAKAILAAEWVYGHERSHQQAVQVARSEALFRPGHPALQLERLRDCTRAQIVDAVREHMSVGSRSITGWSVPRRVPTS